MHSVTFCQQFATDLGEINLILRQKFETDVPCFFFNLIFFRSVTFTVTLFQIMLCLFHLHLPHYPCLNYFFIQDSELSCLQILSVLVYTPSNLLHGLWTCTNWFISWPDTLLDYRNCQVNSYTMFMHYPLKQTI